ncbi:MAG: PmoA family protein [Prevotellaceae bacterium]|jgi:hypothetical protein|nr:PmoA family protein [Prevotellaceae bacterium]
MKKAVLLTAVLFAAIALAAGEIKISVEAGWHTRNNCIVQADVSQLNIDGNAAITMYETGSKTRRAVACQTIVEDGKIARICWLLDGETRACTRRTFAVHTAVASAGAPLPAPLMSADDDGKTIVLKKDGHSILQYNHARVEPPEGVKSLYGRSGFLHPVWSPAGNVLTTIQPKDHIHHYGIWNPWTKIEYGGKIYDLWNIGGGQGTVKSERIETKYGGNIFTGYTATLAHCIFDASKETVIMTEEWRVKAWNVPEGFLWDFESHLTPAVSLPVLIKEYRYAGFGYRATETWTKNNCEMLTSEGKIRRDIDGTRARWIYVTGAAGNGRAGLLFMAHPANYNSPEPLRIWDENANGNRGDVFINFAPTKNRDWLLEPASRKVLQYRILAYDGEMTAARANQLWIDFAYPPMVVISG